MRRPVSVLIALVVMAAMLGALAAPALADDRDIFDFDRFGEDFEDCFIFDGVLICDDDFDRDDFDRDIFDRDFFDLDGFEGALDQDVEQDAESGDVDQSFDVSQTGDNSNQCVSTQGVANTGNAQNTIGVTDFGFEDDNGDRFFDDGFDRDGDIEIEDSGADIDVSPTNTTTCTSEVNQAAS